MILAGSVHDRLARWILATWALLGVWLGLTGWRDAAAAGSGQGEAAPQAAVTGSAPAGLSPGGASTVGLFPKGAPPAPTLIVVDLRAFPEELGLATTMTSLQGIVNQTQPRLFLVRNEFDEMWVEWLRERGDVENLERKDAVGSLDLIRQFRAELEGQVVVDPDLPATINVATMLAATDRLLITYPRVAASFAQRYNLPIVVDLRGRFNSSAEAYRWAWENLWPRLGHHALAMLHPSVSPLRDFLIQQKIFVWWQSGSLDGVEPGNSPMAEWPVTTRVLAESPPHIPVLGYPWRGDGVGPGETLGVEVFSRYAKFLVPTDLAGNLSVHASTRPFTGPSTPPRRLRPPRLPWHPFLAKPTSR